MISFWGIMFVMCAVVSIIITLILSIFIRPLNKRKLFWWLFFILIAIFITRMALFI